MNILSQPEIEDITGLKMPKHQLSWFHKNGYHAARLNAKNKVVLSTLYFHQQSGAMLENRTNESNDPVLNLDALNKLIND